MKPDTSSPSGVVSEPAVAQGASLEATAGKRPQLIPGGGAPPDEEQASPQEQSELEQVVTKALRMIHGQKSRAATMKLLHDPNGTIPEVVGRAAVNLLSTIGDMKNASTKESISPDVLKEAAAYVIPELLTTGIAAGIFDVEDAPDGAEVGTGNTEYDQLVQLSTLEAAKAYGEKRLAGPNAEAESAAAADDWAAGVAEEVRNGTADPEYMARARPAPQGEAKPQLIETES
jgi:hypothetical protein